MTRDIARRRPFWADVLLLGLAGVVFVTLIGLGNWQVRRLAWKLDLIEQVETRAFGTAQAVPAPGEPALQYLRVTATGTYLHQHSQRIKAVTDLGPGHWVITPLETEAQTIWINRGFVPTGLPKNEWREPEGPQSVSGLVRESRPNGTVLEKNDPDAGRWVSPDIGALSAHARLGNAAAYYLDADHAGPVTAWPRGGLTKVEFRNPHLSYAITWYTMAAMLLAAIVFLVRVQIKSRGEP